MIAEKSIKEVSVNFDNNPPSIFRMRKWNDCIAVVPNTMFKRPGIVEFDKYVRDKNTGNLELVESGREMASNLFHSIFQHVKKESDLVRQ